MRGNTFRPIGGDRVGVLTGDEGAHEISCFSDEVVIDFPSVAPAVERIRRAFLADENPARLSAIIQLSDREASDGATVPLEVPLRCICRHCGGRGELWTEACPRCTGTGDETLRHMLHVTIPAGVADGARFRFSVVVRHTPPTRVELHVLVGPATRFPS